MKKILSVMMAGVMMLSLAACGGNDDAKDSSSPATSTAPAASQAPANTQAPADSPASESDAPQVSDDAAPTDGTETAPAE